MVRFRGGVRHGLSCLHFSKNHTFPYKSHATNSYVPLRKIVAFSHKIRFADTFSSVYSAQQKTNIKKKKKLFVHVQKMLGNGWYILMIIYHKWMTNCNFHLLWQNVFIYLFIWLLGPLTQWGWAESRQMKRAAHSVQKANSLETDGLKKLTLSATSMMDSRQWEKFLFLCRAHIISHQPYAQFLQQETQSGMLKRPLEKQRFFSFFFQRGESFDICTVLNTLDKESTSLYMSRFSQRLLLCSISNSPVFFKCCILFYIIFLRILNIQNVCNILNQTFP